MPSVTDAFDVLTDRAYRLRCAGDRIVALISRCSDQVSHEQRVEHDRFVAAIKRIWDEAKTD